MFRERIRDRAIDQYFFLCTDTSYKDTGEGPVEKYCPQQLGGLLTMHEHEFAFTTNSIAPNPNFPDLPASRSSRIRRYYNFWYFFLHSRDCQSWWFAVAGPPPSFQPRRCLLTMWQCFRAPDWWFCSCFFKISTSKNWHPTVEPTFFQVVSKIKATHPFWWWNSKIK